VKRATWPDHNRPATEPGERDEWCPESGCLADPDAGEWAVCPSCGLRLPLVREGDE
jgi:membrane protease subunit (stomatin/prohibitin family)